jgi:carboxymethylenebutenolidase
MPAVLCPPVSGDSLPAIVVVHEIFGLVEHTEDLAGRFAREGYVALAPDLFWHLGSRPTLTDRESFMRFRMSLDDRQMVNSLDAAIAYLREQPFVDGSRIGIIGFCMGAYYAFLEAAHDSSLAACADFYGAPIISPELTKRRPRTLLDAARDLRVPFLGMFGEDDQSIPVDQVRQLEAVLEENEVPHEIHIYPNAGHGFFNDTDDRYRRHAAEDAWPRTLDFFARYMKG